MGREETGDDADASVRASTRIPDGAPRRLRGGLSRLRMAEARPVQLGARLVRRACAGQRAAGAVDRGRGRKRAAAVVRRALRALEPGRQLPARPWRAARRPHPADAGQRRAAVGGDAGRRSSWASVVIPATTLLARDDLLDRFARGGVRHVVVGVGGRRQVRRHRGRLHAHRRRRRRARLEQPGGGVCGRAPSSRRTGQRGQRSDAALLHLRHHRQAEAGAAHPPELSGRPSVDDVLARPAARRRPPEHQLARLGEARLELLLRAVERRRQRLHLQLRALQRQGGAGHRRPPRRDDAVRAADRLADVHPGGPAVVSGEAARGDRRRRAAEPGGHRAGAERLGPDDPRRLRPDRDDGADRQLARTEAEAGLDGPAAARLSGRAARSRRPRGGRRARSRCASIRGRPD